MKASNYLYPGYLLGPVCSYFGQPSFHFTSLNLAVKYLGIAIAVDPNYCTRDTSRC